MQRGVNSDVACVRDTKKCIKIQRYRATVLQRHRDTSLSEASTVECAHETNDNIKLQTDRDGQMDRQRRTSHGNLHDTLSFQWLLLLLLLPGLGEAAAANPRLSASCTYILSPRCHLAVARCPLKSLPLSLSLILLVVSNARQCVHNLLQFSLSISKTPQRTSSSSSSENESNLQ